MRHTQIDWLTVSPGVSSHKCVQLKYITKACFSFSFYQNTTTSTNNSILHSNSLQQSPQLLTPSSATMSSSAASTLLNGHTTTSFGSSSSSRLFNGHRDVGGLRSDSHRQPLDWFDKFKDISVKEEPADADRWGYLFVAYFFFPKSVYVWFLNLEHKLLLVFDDCLDLTLVWCVLVPYTNLEMGKAVHIRKPFLVESLTLRN